MNILFVVPLNESFETILGASQKVLDNKLNIHRNIKKLNTVYPSGVLSVAAYVKKHVPESSMKIVDFNIFLNRRASELEKFEGYSFRKFIQEALELVGDFKPDIIGISTLFNSVFRDLGPLTSFLREWNPKSVVVCGGHLATTLYEPLVKEVAEMDGVAFGEGEIPFLELVQAVKLGREQEFLASSPSWVTRGKCGSTKSFVPQNKVIFELDEIPPYDLRLLLFPDVYFQSSNYLFMLEEPSDKKEMIMFSTRGCPFSCVFCASHRVHGKQVRSYSGERVKEDIIHYHERYGITKFTFYDDHFLYEKERALEILNFISQKGFLASVINPAFFSIDKIIASAMRKAGVKSVILSIESGNEHTFKKIIHKPSDLKTANDAVDTLHQEGINVAANALIGLPGETKEAIRIGTEYLLTTNFNWFNCFVASPLPGSELYEICLKNGYFVETDQPLSLDFKKCVVKTKEFSPEYIEKTVYEMNLKLNFVHNFDYRMGNFDVALMLFEKIVHSVLPTHAFACYFAAKCCRKLQLTEKFLAYKTRFEELTEKYPFWREWAAHFQLEKLHV